MDYVTDLKFIDGLNKYLDRLEKRTGVRGEVVQEPYYTHHEDGSRYNVRAMIKHGDKTYRMQNRGDGWERAGW